MPINNYYNLGKTGLKVSRLALGTMTFGKEWGWGNSREESQQIFNQYLDLGGNFIDTADMYTGGTSERYIGEFMKERKNREEIVLSTKFTFNTAEGHKINAGGNGRKNIKRSVEDSLRRLKTDYIDLYIMHCWDKVTPVEEVMRSLDDLVREGKILHAGLSNVPAWYASRAQSLAQHRGYEPICTFQLEYSLIQRAIENEYIDLGQITGAGIMAWSPLGGGLLSGKYKPGIEGQKDVEGRLKKITDDGGEVSSKDNERNWGIVKALHEVSHQIDQPMASTAINWVANQSNVGSVIIGATKMSQLESNMKALDFEIPLPLMEVLNKASDFDKVYPYTFFQSNIQQRIIKEAELADKPAHYHKQQRV
ncbi:aldo/keto reductase [Nonlabens xiamenensis]|uniref:aldo/keto reductase n=1 Tax=Nonlabens xiamenensis TaxID=2341043 RepID=UPI000F60A314|nr:aldo/keto reductase [Nonlabens xiamenensis]